MLGTRILALHCIALHCRVLQATDGECEGSLPEAGASRSANNQVNHPSHAIPAAKAPLSCALCPVTSVSNGSLHLPVLHPTLQRLLSEFIQSPPTFQSKFFPCRGAAVSRRSSRSFDPSPEWGKHFIVARGCLRVSSTKDLK